MRNRHRSLASVLFAIAGTALPWSSGFGHVYAKAPAGGAGGGGGGNAGAGGAGGGKGADDKGGAGGGKGADDKSGEGDDAGEEDEGDDAGEGDDASTAKVSKKQYDALLSEKKVAADNAKKLAKQLKELQDSMPTKEELEELREARVKAQEAEVERRKKAGEWDKILAEKEAKHNKALAETKLQTETWRNRYVKSSIRNTLATIVPKYTGASITDVAAMLESSFDYDEENDRVFVKGDDGMEMTNPDTGKPMTPEEFIEAEVAKRPYLATFKPLGGAGSSNQRGKGSGAGHTAESLQSMPMSEYLKLRKDIKAGVQPIKAS